MDNKTKKRRLAAREVLTLPDLREDLRQGLEDSDNWEAALAEYARLYVSVDYKSLSQETLSTLEELQEEEEEEEHQPEAESEEAEFYQEVRGAEDPPPPPPPEPPPTPQQPTAKKQKIWEAAAQALEEAGVAGLSLEEAVSLMEAAFPERKANRKKQTRDLLSYWLPKRRIKVLKISGRYYLAKFAPNNK